MKNIPIIENLKTFLPIARAYGYAFYNQYCFKSIIYDPFDCIIQININLANGIIQFKAYSGTKEVKLGINDKKYLLKNIKHLVKWVTLEELEEIL